MKNSTKKTLMGLLVTLVAAVVCASGISLTPVAFADVADRSAATPTAAESPAATPAVGAALRDDSVDPASGQTARPVVDAGEETPAPAPAAGPVPNIIITNFTYGEGSVPVGGSFDLSFTFQNMGRVAIDNLVVTVDGGENFAIAGGTNTFYYDALYAGWAMTQTVPMQALSSAHSGAQGVNVGFKYEYVDAGVRSASSSDIKISVPVSQPDRFQLNDPVPPDAVNVGEETTISMDYVNKGKGDIANVEASIEGDGIDSAVKTQYVGNVASGANGSIGFAFTPTTPGEISATLRVTYEDSDGKPQTKEFPITLNAQEPAPMDMMVDPDTGLPIDPMADGTQTGIPWWGWLLAALAVVALIVGVVVLVRRRRRKKARHADIDEEWGDWESGADPGAGPHDGATTQVIADQPIGVPDASPSN